MHMPLANLLFAPENWVVIGVIALLLFGKKLPEVGRSLGKGIVEFKKGLQGIEEDIEHGINKSAQTNTDRPALPANYKFDPYTGKPIAQDPPAPAQMKFDPYTGKPLGEPTMQSSPSNT
jgi:sec-independent protein translocase protein TatA